MKYSNKSPGKNSYTADKSIDLILGQHFQKHRIAYTDGSLEQAHVIDSAAVISIDVPEYVKYLYDFPIWNTEIRIFMLSAELTRRLGLNGRPFIAVQEIADMEPDMPVLYEVDGEYYIDGLTYDEPSQLFWIERDGHFVFLTDLTVLGTPIGYCPRKDVNDELLKFRKITSR